MKIGTPDRKIGCAVNPRKSFKLGPGGGLCSPL